MKESIGTSLSWIKANYSKLGLTINSLLGKQPNQVASAAVKVIKSEEAMVKEHE